jgi:hypothetical protein
MGCYLRSGKISMKVNDEQNPDSENLHIIEYGISQLIGKSLCLLLYYSHSVFKFIFRLCKKACLNNCGWHAKISSFLRNLCERDRRKG